MKRIVLVDYVTDYYFYTIDKELANWIIKQYNKYDSILEYGIEVSTRVPITIYAVPSNKIKFDINDLFIERDINKDDLFPVSDLTKIVFTIHAENTGLIPYIYLYDVTTNRETEHIPIFKIKKIVNN